jgi:excisionase family DNA binding protein
MITHEGRKYYNIEELSEYLPEKPTIRTIYNWTSNNQIPFRKFGRSLYFDKEKIKEWEQNNRKMNY